MAAKRFPIMAITHNKQVLLKQVPYLNQIGYAIELFTTAAAAISSIESGKSKPRVILVSWTLPKENISALYAKFMNDLEIPTIVFSEDQSRKINNELLKSRIPNVIFPPISGFGINRRILQLLRVKTLDEAIDSLDAEMQGEDQSKEMAQETSQMMADIAKEKVVLEDRFIGSLKTVKGIVGKPARDGKCKVLMIPVSWRNLQGYLVISQSAEYSDADLKILRKNILDFLAEKSHLQTDANDYIEFETDYNQLFDWAKSHAEILTSEGEIINQMLVAFVNLSELPGISRAVTDEYVSANLDGWIKLNMKLPFDIFIHLQTNEKFIRYLRKDATISEETLSRLNKVGTDRCFLEPKSSPDLFKHCIENKMASKK